MWESAFSALFHTMHGLSGAGSALGIAQGRAVDADSVALVPEATEERVHEAFVAEHRLPFGIVEIGRNDGGPLS